MKRLVKLWGMILVMLFCTTGCYDYQVKMSINDDKSVALEMGLSLDITDYADELGITDSSDIDFTEYTGIDKTSINSLEKRGFKVKEEHNGYKYSISISKEYENIDDISSEAAVKVDLDKIIDSRFKEIYYQVDKSSLKNTYTGDFIFDLTMTDDTEGLEDYEDLMNFQYVLKVGQNVKVSDDNNASNVNDDKTEYIWDLKVGEKNEVNYSFSLANPTTTYLIFGCVAVLIILALVGFMAIKKANNDKKESK